MFVNCAAVRIATRTIILNVNKHCVYNLNLKITGFGKSGTRISTTLLDHQKPNKVSVKLIWYGKMMLAVV